MKIFHFFADDFLWFLMLFLFFYYWRIHCTYSRATSRTVKTEVVSLLLSQNFIFIAFIYLSLNQVYNHFFLRCISAAFFIEIFIYISIYILARFLSVFSSSFHCAIFHHCVTWHEWRQQKTKKPKLVPSLSFSFSFFYFRLHLAY